jgi:IS30 family transposase
MLLHLPDRHDAEAVAAAMIEAMQDRRRICAAPSPGDRGPELGGYRDIQLQLNAPVYFCDPHSPWQRGTNENTNRLLRFWFAKGSNLRIYSKTDLQRVQDMLNKRPRPTLHLETPADRLNALLTQAA